MDQLKKCEICGDEKSLEDFHRRSAASDGRQSRCKVCAIALTAKWRSEHRDQNRDYQREWKRDRDRREHARFATIKRKYGITREQYDAMFEAQGGLCAICKQPPAGFAKKHRDYEGEPEPRTWLDIDHDEKTGQVRGLLCCLCNPGIGFFNHEIERLLAAAEYLRLFVV